MVLDFNPYVEINPDYRPPGNWGGHLSPENPMLTKSNLYLCRKERERFFTCRGRKTILCSSIVFAFFHFFFFRSHSLPLILVGEMMFLSSFVLKKVNSLRVRRSDSLELNVKASEELSPGTRV